MKRADPPHGVFSGHNLMTPNVCGYFKLVDGWAELSSGEGMERQLIWGVTVRPDAGRSKLFQSERRARAYIAWLS